MRKILFFLFLLSINLLAQNEIIRKLELKDSLALKVPTARTITINGVSHNLSSNPSYTITSTPPDSGVFATHNWVLGRGYITSANIGGKLDTSLATVLLRSHWSSAYGWGNHASAGYLTSSSSLDPSKVSETSSYRFVTDTEKGTWNGKQNALGFTPYTQTEVNNLLGAKVDTSRTLTINGVAHSLGANRSWTITANPDSGVFATRHWVNSLGFLTSIDSLKYGTHNYINNQGFLKSTDITGKINYSDTASVIPTKAFLSLYHYTKTQTNTLLGAKRDTTYLSSITSDIQHQLTVGLAGKQNSLGFTAANNDSVYHKWQTYTKAETNGLLGAKKDTTNLSTLSSDVQHQLNAKSPIANPTFSGIVKLSTDTLATKAYARSVGGGSGGTPDTSTYALKNYVVNNYYTRTVLGGMFNAKLDTSLATVALRANWSAAYSASHSHSNKTKLDSLSNSASVLNSLTSTIISNSHTDNANRAKLDSILVAASRINAIPSSYLTLSNYVCREVPSGTKNGVDSVFTLAYTPVSGTEMVFLNGLLQNAGAGNDYTISTNTITFLVSYKPKARDVILVTYWK